MSSHYRYTEDPKPEPLVWEDIAEGVARSRTPTGWLVREYSQVCHFNALEHENITSGYDWRTALTFVPDPDGVWLKGEE